MNEKTSPDADEGTEAEIVNSPRQGRTVSLFLSFGDGISEDNTEPCRRRFTTLNTCEDVERGRARWLRRGSDGCFLPCARPVIEGSLDDCGRILPKFQLATVLVMS